MLLITAQTKHSYTAAQGNRILMICAQKNVNIRKLDEDSPGISAAFWVMRVFQHISPRCGSRPSTPSTVRPPGGKGGKIRLQSISKILRTQTHFLVLREGGLAGSQDDCGAGASRPPPLRQLVTSSADGTPSWQPDYGQSAFQGARGEETFRAEMRKWGLI